MPWYDAIVEGTTGDDVLDGQLYPLTHRLWFRGFGGNDRIVSTNPGNFIQTGAGNDRINSVGGVVYAGAGNDEVNITGSTTATVRDGAGSDHIFISMDKGARAYVEADCADPAGDDWYIVNNTGTIARLSYSALAWSGPLTIDARSGIAFGKDIGTDHFAGFSEIVGGNFSTTIYANDSGMRIWGGLGANYIWGGAGDDVISAKGYFNSITDNTGGLINIRCGDPSNHSRETVDHIIVSSTGNGTVDFGRDAGNAKLTIDDSMTGVSNRLTIHAGNGFNDITGNSAFETIFLGLASSGTVELMANGIIYVDHLMDSPVPSTRSSCLFRSSVAGSYIETASYAATYEDIKVYGGVPGQFQVSSQYLGTDFLLGIERIIGGHGNDTFFNSGGPFASFTGNDGNDTFISTLAPKSGVTLINGGAGNDTMEGGAGIDKIELGDGVNSASGGLGRDDFLFNTDSSAVVGQTQTTIFDFENGIDRIVLGGDYTKEYFLSHLAQDGANTIFTSASGDTLALNNVQVAQLDMTDFILV